MHHLFPDRFPLSNLISFLLLRLRYDFDGWAVKRKINVHRFSRNTTSLSFVKRSIYANSNEKVWRIWDGCGQKENPGMTVSPCVWQMWHLGCLCHDGEWPGPSPGLWWWSQAELWALVSTPGPGNTRAVSCCPASYIIKSNRFYEILYFQMSSNLCQFDEWIHPMREI